MSREFLIVTLFLGGLLGALGAIWHYLVRPIARAVTKLLELLADWRDVPTQLDDLRDLLRRYIEQNERRFEHLEPPLPYTRRKTS